ncbi:SDR family oxidoreductase [Devosia yakushimensis]|uniref:NADP-dependent 3-hydroxy acid dehydrogenase YdfG n=1 Tax=Devosia yakushimensis TaxID=470028 RepID=A0ABQ5U9R0_9HYPH|nr:SDR family NAD(P)-dependent oxidoreductase [Devosia yakushimensis]GLQ08882.1 SDR family oxidoreductase [Devosia yakushimensis]
MPNRTPSTALITGASSGIGAAYARRLAARGYDLVLVARRADRLETLAVELTKEFGIEVRPVIADLATHAGTAQVAEILASDTSIDMLVNNAGISRLGATMDLSPAALDDMVALNITALTRLSRAALPGFVARNRGTIVNIGSVLAFRAMPIASVYSGTKSYVLLFTSGLQEELKDTAIRVQAVLPAGVATEIYDGTILPLDQIPPELVMQVDAMVDAALAGLDSGELVTLPSVSDLELLSRYTSAQADLFSASQTGRPAARYGV